MERSPRESQQKQPNRESANWFLMAGGEAGEVVMCLVLIIESLVCTRTWAGCITPIS